MAKAANPRSWALPLRSDGLRYSVPPVGAPNAIARTVNSATQITLQASGGSSSLGSNAGYRYRRDGLLLNSVATASAFVDSGRAASTTYNYTATLVDSAGNESEWSAVFSATTPAASDTVPPTAPVISALALSASTIRIALNSPATDSGSGLRDYTLETSITQSGPWTALVSGASAAVFPYTHAGLPSGALRYYRLVAFDNVGNQATSGVVSATTQGTSSLLMYGRSREYDPGPITHYAQASKTTPGAGTQSDPLTKAQAEQLNTNNGTQRVHCVWLDGVGTFPSTDNRFVPLFSPAFSGTQTHRIVHRCLNRGAVEFRHTSQATPPSYGVGCPAFGVTGKQWVILDGFYVNGQFTEYHSDTGHVIVHDSDNCELRFDVLGVTLPSSNDNYNGIRLERTSNIVLRQFTIRGIRSGNDAGHNIAAGMTYGTRDLLAEHFEIENCNAGWYIKGTANGGTIFNSGELRFGRIHNTSYPFELQDTNDASGLYVHHCQVTDYRVIAMRYHSATGIPANTRNIRAEYNTFALQSSSSPTASDASAIAFNAAMTGSDCGFNYNIVEMRGVNGPRLVIGGQQIPASMDRNCYWNFGFSTRWDGLGQSFTSLTAWQEGSGRDLNSIVADPLFLNRSTRDLRLASNSPARVVGPGGTPIGCWESPGASPFIGLES